MPCRDSDSKVEFNYKWIFSIQIHCNYSFCSHIISTPIPCKTIQLSHYSTSLSKLNHTHCLSDINVNISTVNKAQTDPFPLNTSVKINKVNMENITIALVLHYRSCICSNTCWDSVILSIERCVCVCVRACARV